MKLSFSHEPVAWITVIIIVLNVVKDFLTHSLDLATAVSSIVVALGGVVARAKVSPTVNRDVW